MQGFHDPYRFRDLTAVPLGSYDPYRPFHGQGHETDLLQVESTSDVLPAAAEEFNYHTWTHVGVNVGVPGMPLTNFETRDAGNDLDGLHQDFSDWRPDGAMMGGMSTESAAETTAAANSTDWSLRDDPHERSASRAPRAPGRQPGAIPLPSRRRSPRIVVLRRLMRHALWSP